MAGNSCRYPGSWHPGNGNLYPGNPTVYDLIDKAIIAENVKVGDNVTLGIGNEAPNKLRSDIYNSGLVTIGENSVIPAGVQIGKNTAISGITVKEDYVQGALESGGVLIKAGDRS